MRAISSIALLALVLSGCILTRDTGFPADSDARRALEVPERFEPREAAWRIEPGDTLAGRACLNPMVDPRDGTELRLVRSVGPRGDYHVPAGRYGVGQDELLRLDCNTGRPLGVVAR